MPRSRKAISPVIATVIIIAVTLAIAIAVAGWIMGLWGTMGSTESLQIYPDSYINSTHVCIHVKNTGTAGAVIYKISIEGYGNATIVAVTQEQGTAKLLNGNRASIDAGAKAWVYATLPKGFTPVSGQQYSVKVYTEAGNVYSSLVLAK